MTDPSLILRWGDFEAAAYGYFAIVALVGLIIIFHRWLAKGR
jgi:hypothetical protein